MRIRNLRRDKVVHGNGTYFLLPCVTPEGCEYPERLKLNPVDWSEEQIRQCHGNRAGHPCLSE